MKLNQKSSMRDDRMSQPWMNCTRRIKYCIKKRTLVSWRADCSHKNICTAIGFDPWIYYQKWKSNS